MSTVIVFASALACTEAAHARFRSSGGSYQGDSSGGLACVQFTDGRSAGPKRHGVVCGLTRRGAGCSALTGRSLVIVLDRRGAVRCARSGDLSIEGRVPGGFSLSLSAESCGAGVFEFSAGGGIEAPPCPFPSTARTPPLGQAPSPSAPGAGTHFRRGRLRCVVVTSDELRRYDPSIGNTDAVFCVRRTASTAQGIGVVFDDGNERLPQRDLRIDPATGCGSGADFGLPDLPICP